MPLQTGSDLWDTDYSPSQHLNDQRELPLWRQCYQRSTENGYRLQRTYDVGIVLYNITIVLFYYWHFCTTRKVTKLLLQAGLCIAFISWISNITIAPHLCSSASFRKRCRCPGLNAVLRHAAEIWTGGVGVISGISTAQPTRQRSTPETGITMMRKNVRCITATQNLCMKCEMRSLPL